jgi:hypothetical protein
VRSSSTGAARHRPSRSPRSRHKVGRVFNPSRAKAVGSDPQTFRRVATRLTISP